MKQVELTSKFLLVGSALVLASVLSILNMGSFPRIAFANHETAFRFACHDINQIEIPIGGSRTIECTFYNDGLPDAVAVAITQFTTRDVGNNGQEEKCVRAADNVNSLGFTCELDSDTIQAPPGGSDSFNVILKTWRETVNPGDFELKIYYEFCANARPPGCFEDPTTTGDILVPFKVIEKPTLEITASTTEITPKIGQTTFRSIIDRNTGRIDGTASSLQPEVLGGDVTLTATLTGVKDPSGVPINFSFEPDVANDAGHSHFTAVNDDIKRAFGGFLTSGGAQLTDRGETDQNGKYSAIFRAMHLNSRYSSAAGVVEFTAVTDPNTSWDPETAQDQERVTIRIPNLERLNPSPNYITYGDNTATHNGNNHYGTDRVTTALENIAQDYRNARRETLRIGQMSLQWGGVFEICGTFRAEDGCANAPNGGHLSHACGTDVDIGGFAINNRGRQTELDRRDLRELGTLVNTHYAGAFVIDEGDHYHIHFENCR